MPSLVPSTTTSLIQFGAIHDVDPSKKNWYQRVFIPSSRLDVTIPSGVYSTRYMKGTQCGGESLAVEGQS